MKEGSLLAGAYPDGGRLNLLLEAGLDTFVDLTECSSYLPRLRAAEEMGHGKYEYHPFPIPDGATPSQAQMAAILSTIDRAVAAGRKVYVHCEGGSGRTGTVVGCYLVEHGLKPQEAFEWMAAQRRAGWGDEAPCSPETEAQRRMVEGWGDKG